MPPTFHPLQAFLASQVKVLIEFITDCCSLVCNKGLMIPASGIQAQTRLQRYDRGNKLGKGVTGSVYLGVDKVNSQYVAIKVVKNQTIDNQVKVYLLKSETNALAGLHHPNIVKCLDIIQTDRECLFIMEYCPDGTLNDLIQRRGKIPESQALNILRGIAAGYRACKDGGVVHRDLKPSNILMANGVPKITDFGFCQINGSIKPKMYYNVGSPSYMSPQAYMDSAYSEKSDVWAIGMIFYEMLIGKPLTVGKDIEDIYTYIHRGKQFIPNGISDLSKTIISSCLRYSRHQRMGIYDLERLLNSNINPATYSTSNQFPLFSNQQPFNSSPFSRQEKPKPQTYNPQQQANFPNQFLNGQNFQNQPQLNQSYPSFRQQPDEKLLSTPLSFPTPNIPQPIPIQQPRLPSMAMLPKPQLSDRRNTPHQMNMMVTRQQRPSMYNPGQQPYRYR